MSAATQPALDLPPTHWALLQALLDPDRSIPDILKELSLSARDLLAAVPALTAALQSLASLSSLRNQLLSLPKALTSLESVCTDSADPIERRRAATTIARVAISPPRIIRHGKSSIFSSDNDPFAAAAAKLESTLSAVADDLSSHAPPPPPAPQTALRCEPSSAINLSARPLPSDVASEFVNSSIPDLLSPLPSPSRRSRAANLATRAGALAAGP